MASANGVFVYGIDHVTGNCTPFRCVLLGQFGGKNCSNTGSVPCAASSSAKMGTGIPADIAKTPPLNPNTPYAPGMPTYPAPVPNGRNVTGPYQSPLPGAGTTGGQGLG